MLLSAGARIKPLNDRIKDETQFRDQIQHLPHTTKLFLLKCGLKVDKDLFNVQEVMVKPLTLLNMCVLTIRALLQETCFNIWSGLEFLNLPPGFEKDILKLNWRVCSVNSDEKG